MRSTHGNERVREREHAMSGSCLKVRCPQCKGRTRLAADAFAELRRRPSIGIDHLCEHCGHRFAATLHTGASPAMETPPAPAPLMELIPVATVVPAAAPALAPVAASVATPSVAPVAAPAAIPVAPFAPKAAVAASAPPFGLLGERNAEAPGRARAEAPAGSPPPFASGAAFNPP